MNPKIKKILPYFLLLIMFLTFGAFIAYPSFRGSTSEEAKQDAKDEKKLEEKKYSKEELDKLRVYEEAKKLGVVKPDNNGVYDLKLFEIKDLSIDRIENCLPAKEYYYISFKINKKPGIKQKFLSEHSIDRVFLKTNRGIYTVSVFYDLPERKGGMNEYPPDHHCIKGTKVEGYYSFYSKKEIGEEDNNVHFLFSLKKDEKFLQLGFISSFYEDPKYIDSGKSLKDIENKTEFVYSKGFFIDVSKIKIETKQHKGDVENMVDNPDGEDYDTKY